MKATEGWAALEETARSEDRAQQMERYRLDLLYARIFGSDEGRQVLAHLRALTVEQPAWVPGQDPSHGFAREGQNSIVREIERRVRRAAEGPPQADR